MTTTIDLDQLEATAKAATAGVWEVDRNTPFSREIMGIFQPDEKRYVVRVDDNFPDNPPGVSDADAAHIAAARPEVVLALIERLRTAEDALSTPPADDVREALDRHLREAVRMGIGWPKADFLDRWIAERLDTILAKVRPHGTVTDADRAAINGALIEGLPLWVGATEQGHAQKALLDGIVAALEAAREARP